MALGTARIVCCVEHEASAAELLATRMEEGWLDNAPVWTNLHTFDGRAWRGRVSGIIGGYPCQPFSVAGKRLGTADPRHLWPSIARIIAECEPAWAFFENVGGHLRLGYWDVVRPDLERLGYRVAEGLFTASEVGAPHQRERLFILGVADAGQPLRRGATEQAGQPGAWAPDDDRGAGGTLADAECERGCVPATGGYTSIEGAGATIPPFPPGPGDTEAWQRILREHPELAPAVEPAICRVVDGVAGGVDLPRAARLRLTGNGVVPQCAALAFRTLWRQLADAGHAEQQGGADED